MGDCRPEGDIHTEEVFLGNIEELQPGARGIKSATTIVDQLDTIKMAGKIIGRRQNVPQAVIKRL
jgi:hypothetical protein